MPGEGGMIKSPCLCVALLSLSLYPLISPLFLPEFAHSHCVFPLFQMFNNDTGEFAYAMLYDASGEKKMPVTSITFPPPIDKSKPEHSHILTATCKLHHKVSEVNSSAFIYRTVS